MKYIIVPYIALGFVLSMAVGIEYTCVGDEVLPEYSGSPFIFKKKSLVTSMEYYYSIIGLLGNILVWSSFLFALRFGLYRCFKNSMKQKAMWIGYRIIVVVLIAFSTLNITIESVVLGKGFKKGFNYWYIDMDENATTYQMECEGKTVFFRE